MSYDMRHALNTMFCLLSVSFLISELFCSHTHDRYATVCYINKQPGRGYHFFQNKCVRGERRKQK